MKKIEIQYYYLGIRKKNCQKDSFYLANNYNFQEIRFPMGKRYWAADPFIIEEGNEIFIFYECFDMFRGKGTIACSKVVDSVASKPVIVIDEEFHLSFPMIFKVKNDYYMIPESETSRSIILYKCIEFPYKWGKAKVLLDDVKACDSVILKDETDRYRIITSLMDEKSTTDRKNYCFVHNAMYELDKDLNIIEQSRIVLSEGDYGIRNAGSIIKNGEEMIRVAQDCTGGRYGRGVVLWNIDSLHPYVEREIANIDYLDAADHITHADHSGEIEGIHTYNTSENYEIIDFTIFNRLPEYYKMYYFIGHKFVKLFNILKRMVKGLR